MTGKDKKAETRKKLVRKTADAQRKARAKQEAQAAKDRAKDKP